MKRGALRQEKKICPLFLNNFFFFNGNNFLCILYYLCKIKSLSEVSFSHPKHLFTCQKKLQEPRTNFCISRQNMCMCISHEEERERVNFAKEDEYIAHLVDLAGKRELIWLVSHRPGLRLPWVGLQWSSHTLPSEICAPFLKKILLFKETRSSCALRLG